VAALLRSAIAQERGGEYCLELFAVITVALLASGIVAVSLRPCNRRKRFAQDEMKAHGGGHDETRAIYAPLPRALVFCIAPAG